MMETPELSIVVNAYNTERYIGACLRSIFALEEAPPMEVIVIDDCSTDGTEQVVRSFDDPRLIYLRNEVNLNAAASVNIAMAKARGRYIARIDSDDEYRPQYLKRTLPLLREHPSVGLVYGDVAYMEAEGQLNGGTAGVGSRRQARPAIARELVPLLFDNFIPAATMIARREAWADVLPVPAGRNFCDWYWTLNMARRWDFAFVDEVLAHYRLHPGNMHKDMVRHKYGESITWQNLAEIFAKENFGPNHAQLHDSVHATQARSLGIQYFGFAMLSDARRCFIKALQHQPHRLLTDPQLLRLLLASFLPPALYQKLKSFTKRG
jgi:glycosyltransferase involved in cell wall biosynthesis